MAEPLTREELEKLREVAAVTGLNSRLCQRLLATIDAREGLIRELRDAAQDIAKLCDSWLGFEYARTGYEDPDVKPISARWLAAKAKAKEVLGE